MRHLTEEEWIEFYYGESQDRAWIQEHLLSCAACSAMAQAMGQDLAQLRVTGDEPQQGHEYGERIWRGLRPSLAPYPRTEKARLGWNFQSGWNFRLGLRIAGAAAALAAIVLAAFYAGQRWEQKRTPQAVAVNSAQAKQRIILLVVGDHLDRTQRLLAELNDPEQAAADRGLQATARKLLTENRLYRQSAERGNTATRTEDSSIETLLDELEPVLVELANQPGELNSAEVIRLRKELNTGGLLFEIRVLRSKARTEEQTDSGASAGGKA